MNPKYENLLAGKNETIRALWAAVFIGFGLAVIMGVGWMLAPNQLRIHVPPDLSSGAVLRPDEAGQSNVYAFTYYIWQQLYRWPKDGETDYEDRIHMLRHYLTPGCFQDRLDDFTTRRQRRELNGRERAVWEIPGRGFSPERVVSLGNGSWRVYLDLLIEETMLGEPIKTRAVNYPLSVVRYNIDPEHNAFGIAIDCLADTPMAIELSETQEQLL